MVRCGRIEIRRAADILLEEKGKIVENKNFALLVSRGGRKFNDEREATHYLMDVGGNWRW